MRATLTLLCAIAALSMGCGLTTNPAGSLDRGISYMTPFRDGCLYKFLQSGSYVYVPQPCRATEQPQAPESEK